MSISITEAINSSNLIWLKDRVLFLTIHGSTCYGTNMPESDLDYKGFCIAPKEYFYGVLNKFEQAEFKEPDAVIYAFNKFVSLAMENNPNVIETLFTEPEYHVIKHPIIEPLIGNKEFLSKKLRYTMGGFAFAQIKRLRLHKSWLQKGDLQKPNRADFGLPENKKLIPEEQLLEIESLVKIKLEEWNPDTTGMDYDASIAFRNKLYDILIDLKINSDDFANYAARSVGLNDSLMEAFKKERQYRTALKEYHNYCEWKKNRNRERFESEQKFGFDAKFGYHIVRLLTNCVDFFRTGEFIVKCKNAEELKEIRKGAWSYEKLMEFSENQEKLLDELYEKSTIKREPNRKLIDQLVIDITGNYLSK
jgi:predicted nucleotidyltransferase